MKSVNHLFSKHTHDMPCCFLCDCIDFFMNFFLSFPHALYLDALEPSSSTYASSGHSRLRVVQSTTFYTNICTVYCVFVWSSRGETVNVQIALATLHPHLSFWTGKVLVKLDMWYVIYMKMDGVVYNCNIYIYFSPLRWICGIKNTF